MIDIYHISRESEPNLYYFVSLVNLEVLENLHYCKDLNDLRGYELITFKYNSDNIGNPTGGISYKINDDIYSYSPIQSDICDELKINIRRYLIEHIREVKINQLLDD